MGYEILFKFHPEQGSIIPKTMPYIFPTIILGIVAIFVQDWVVLNETGFSAFGFLVAFLVMVRTTNSYARYLEGLTSIKKIISVSVDLTRMAISFFKGEEAIVSREAQKLSNMLIAYFTLVVLQLRDSKSYEGVGPLLSEQQMEVLARETSNRPILVLQWISQLIDKHVRNGHLSPIHRMMMEENLQNLTRAFGSCVKIHTTPTPYPYAQMTKIFVFALCYIAPFAFVAEMGNFTPVGCFLFALAYFATELVNIELEDPFGEDPNDLQLHEYCETLIMELSTVCAQGKLFRTTFSGKRT